MSKLQIRHYKQGATPVPEEVKQTTEDSLNNAYAGLVDRMNQAEVYVCAYYDGDDKLTHSLPHNCPGQLWPEVSKVHKQLNPDPVKE